MASAMPATSTPTPTTTTVTPLPEYQVSGGAAPHPRNGSGSVGPFFGVLAAVLVVTAMSCFFGRVCAAQAQRPDEWYDCTRLTGRRRCWWWRAPRRPVRPADEAKQPAALPLPEP